MQRLLRYACWDADAVRDDVRACAVDHLGTGGTVPIVDETGFVKKGNASAGVQRQYTGTAGRIENSQLGVFLAYVTEQGRALIDRRLYLPEHSWSNDPQRRREAGIPEDVQFELTDRTLIYGLPWRHAKRATCWPSPARRECGSTRAVHLPARTPSSAVCPPRPGKGTVPATARRAPRHYDWAWVHIGTGSHRHLLIRRNRTTGELAFYRRWSPTEVTPAELVRVAGARWNIEECFQAAKSQVGLDHYHVRHWTSRHRHITLAMLALAFLTAVAVASAAPHRPTEPHHPTRKHEPIHLTVPEIRRLLTAVLTPPAIATTTLLHWSSWRRHQQ